MTICPGLAGNWRTGHYARYAAPKTRDRVLYRRENLSGVFRFARFICVMIVCEQIPPGLDSRMGRYRHSALPDRGAAAAGRRAPLL